MIEEDALRAADLRSGDLQERGPLLCFMFDGKPVKAHAGESVAAALFASGIRVLRKSPRNGEARGMFCLMGSCQECSVWIDGRRTLGCQAIASTGINVRSDDPHGGP